MTSLLVACPFTTERLKSVKVINHANELRDFKCNDVKVYNVVLYKPHNQVFFSLQVLSVGNLYNPDVRYSYNVPIEDKPQQFLWDAYGPWQECSRLCQGT